MKPKKNLIEAIQGVISAEATHSENKKRIKKAHSAAEDSQIQLNRSRQALGGLVSAESKKLLIQIEGRYYVLSKFDIEANVFEVEMLEETKDD